MKQSILFILIAVSSFTYSFSATVSVWKSSEDGQYALTQTQKPLFKTSTPSRQDISIDPTTRYQTILGLGASFEHATCYNLNRLNPTLRQQTLEKIVCPKKGIGMNLMRLCIGTSDFTGEPWYTYNDIPTGETDFAFQQFSIEKDQKYILPIVKEALRINPNLRFYASPWSPPAWMKTNQSLLAGRMDPQFYAVYARYLAKFIQAYRAEGIPIHAITTQNEPDYPNPHYPTCHWTAREQNTFIRDHLGPLFQAQDITTKIWCLDHNWNLLHYPRTILNDPKTAAYVEGTAFHLYEGKVTAQSILKKAFPNKSIYFTEGSTFKTKGAVEIIDILRNGSRSYNAWVVMLDSNRKPNNGPHHADMTPLEFVDRNTVRYHYDYYMYGQFMKFIERGAVRIQSGKSGRRFAHVAFMNPNGDIVLVAANHAKKEKKVVIRMNDRSITDTLPRLSVATFLWQSEKR